ncbi:MAG: class I SAM-dependent methyltransferase [Proteobacteria bacterium]|nr:class I SAM-dependent methyltransferase [Pseudomonadota bacterium]
MRQTRVVDDAREVACRSRRGVPITARVPTLPLSDHEEAQRPESLAFDAAHGVETASFAAWHTYEPSPPSVVEAVLDALMDRIEGASIDAADCTFIDIGCGKGRVLLIASQRGFSRVLGVDPANKLCRAAEQNVRTWSARHPDATRIDVWCEDASRLTWPKGPLLLYLYNPFHEAVMDRMVRSLPRDRPVWLAYVNPLFAEPLRRHGFALIEEATEVDHYAWKLFRR